MNITEMIKLKVFTDSEILAGNEGLSNLVLNATFIDAPDGYQWCKEGDFVLSTGYPFINNNQWEEGLMNLLEILVEKKCSGLGVKLGRYIPKLPSKAIVYANSNGFPIISLPNHISWADMIVPIFTQINKKNQQELEKTHQVYEQFHIHLKNQEDIQELAELLHKITNSPVTIYIRKNNRIVNSATSILSQHDIEKLILELYYNHEQTIQRLQWNNLDCTVRWIYNSERIEGGVFLWREKSNLQTWEKAALEQAAVITALEIERLKTLSTKIQHFKNDFLLMLLDTNNNKTREVLFRNAKEVNWDLEEQYKVVLLDLYSKSDWNSELSLWSKKEELLEIMENEIEWLFPKTPIGFDSQSRFTLLISQEVNTDTLKYKLEKLISKLDSTTFYGGIGRLSSVNKLSTSYNEAKLALKISYENMLKDSNHSKGVQLYIRDFSKLNIERILFSDDPKQEAKNLVTECLSEIINYDKKKNSELLDTLKQFLKHNGNYDKTADSLFIHKNTVRYRMNIIRDLTNLNPGNVKDQLLFQIALATLNSFPVSTNK
ncbi:PucR family transcriptional regulator [Oceanobacillus salinisoli]|uniref:PucR family transcriptional regulator n=1 Tax=Oceanobacillus salinisoli TaxID=2678611 RepID=UPI0012E13563|nr:PucR family transcriptional regulator [Oceanobacillus salinisoli]